MIYIARPPEGECKNAYHSEWCTDAQHTWVFRSDMFREWEGMIRRIGPQIYTLTTNGDPIDSHELHAFVLKYGLISNGGRK